MSIIKPKDIVKRKKIIEEASKDLSPHLKSEISKKLTKDKDSSN